VCFDQAQVDDLAQETFLRLLRHADRYDPAWSMRTWLFTIARRLSITQGERKQFMSRPETLSKIGAAPETVENQVDRRDRLDHTNRLLDRALASLSEPQRTAIVLFYQQGMAVEEMAKVMEMPPGTVKSHLHRARTALADSLSPHSEEFMP
jgi:RNA polymerase sigma-70 factor (ECF subfamily)